MLIRVMILVFMLTLVSVSSGDINIRAILVGDKVLELADTRQLTFKEDGNVTEATISPNGRYVVYKTEHETLDQICVLKTSGGSPKIVLKADYSEEAPKEDIWCLVGSSTPSWSPDSKLFAVQVERIRLLNEIAPEEPSIENWLLIFAWNGTQYASFKIPDELTMFNIPIAWSPNSSNLAFNLVFIPESHTMPGLLEVDTNGNSEIKGDHVVVFSLIDGSARTIYTHHNWLHIDRWTDQGDGLICYYRENDKPLKGIVYLDGRGPQISDASEYDLKPSRLASVDRVFWIFRKSSHLQVEAAATGEVVHTLDISLGQDDFISWLPNSRIFAYNRMQTIKDGIDGKEAQVNSIWLSTLIPGKHSRMCLALDCDQMYQLNWSADSLKTTFIRNGRLYLAELGWRSPTAYEKVEGGLPLTEDEEKEILLNNAREIGTALMLYRDDLEGNLPAFDVNIESQIAPYLQDKNALYRPGTQNMVFRYIPQANGGDIENPVKTIIGIIDVGYSWQINIYADGHATIMNK